MDVNQIKAALSEGLITVNFTKVNGHKRQMVCTLNDAYLPPPHPEKDNKTRDPNLLVVFDTEHHGWRTIKVDAIIDWAPGANSVAPIAEEILAPADTGPLGWTPNTPTP
jgi:hypothetical protein